MAGVRIDNKAQAAWVDDVAEANRLQSRFAVGVPQPGGALRLAPVEAAWLASGKRAEVPVDVWQMLQAQDVAYLCYADLRERGLSVRVGDGVFDVFPRGQTKGPAAYRVRPCAERESLEAAKLGAWATNGDLLAVADEDGDLTYYTLAAVAPAGSVPMGELQQAVGAILGDRVRVDAAVAAAWHAEFLGTQHEDGLWLSFTEAEHLHRRGVLSVQGDLASVARQRQPAFDATLPVFEALRAAGVVAKSGFKFGTHLRGYRADPDEGHAEWLIHCPTARLDWTDVARGARVAHGVRKTFVVWTGAGFVSFAWFKP